MAKRLVSWNLDGTILVMSKIAEVVEGKQTVASKDILLVAKFDLVKLFPTFAEFTDVQKQITVYGTKQKLSDSGAGDIASYEGKVKSAEDKWKELLDGKWGGSRINATGAAENKRNIASMKVTATIISLEGLVMKKSMAGLPGMEAFTPEDEEKLQSFLKTAVSAPEAVKK